MLLRFGRRERWFRLLISMLVEVTLVCELLSPELGAFLLNVCSECNPDVPKSVNVTRGRVSDHTYQ